MKKFLPVLALVAMWPLAAVATMHPISIVDFAFSPASLAVHSGDTVTWTNTSIYYPHTATADNGSFDSGYLQPGQSYTHVFGTTGTFGYSCIIHGFRGSLTVSQVMGISDPSAVLTPTPDFKMLGNPVRDRAVVEISGGDPTAELEVYNLAGALVAVVSPGTASESAVRYEWNTNSVSEGLYLLRVKQPSQTMEHTVLVVR